MELKDYFDSTEGIGVLATADVNGKVNSAIYARPNVMEDGSLAVGPVPNDCREHDKNHQSHYAVSNASDDSESVHSAVIPPTRVQSIQSHHLLC